jgi:thiamine transport system ATP-binding protein
MLAVDGVTVRFGERTVLHRVSLRVGRGETVALLGPSGSGKSTLLRVVAGILVPDEGRVVLDGRDISGLPTHRRAVGMMFQDEQLFPHLSVAANVGFGLKMAGVGKHARSERVGDLLDVVGLAGFGDRSIDRLSGGERKRVALARSLAPDPQLLLLDEPLTGLDRDLHDRLAVEVRAVLRTTGITAVWVTHDADEAAVVADRTVQLATLGGDATDAGDGTVPP